MPAELKRCIKSWKRNLPDYRIKKWDTHNFDIYSIPFVAEACKMRKWAFACDYIRVYALYTEGGIYMDSDVFVRNSLDFCLANRAFSAVECYPESVEKIYAEGQVDAEGNKRKDIFAKYLLEAMLLPTFGNTELYILDDMTRRWSDYEYHPDTAVYDNTTASVQTIFDEVDQRVQSRYEDFAQRQEEALKSEPWIVIVIESSDAVAEISADKKIIGTIKGMLGKYRMMKVLILMTNVENAAIPFSAPDLMKIVKDNRRYIIFDDISNIKLCDLSVSIAKKYAKPIEFCDAFYVNENELTKIKTVKLS